MSRLRRLKERKIKNRIKATSCGLALALVMGSAQSLGTYALFTDNANIIDKLSISTGDVDVYTTEGFKNEEIKKKEITKKFTIENLGTLKQKLKLELTTDTSISNEALENISYSLTMKHAGKNIKPIKLNFNEIKQEKRVDLKYENGEEVILDPQDKIECISKINLNNNFKINKDKVEVNFDLKILARQLGDEGHNGFIDRYTQNNNFLIGKSDLEDLETNLKVELDDHRDKNKHEIDIDAPPNKRFKIVTIVSGTGEFKNIGLCETDSDEFDIIKNPVGEFILGDNGIGTEYSDNQKLIVKIEFTSGNVETWEIKFRYRIQNGKQVLQAYYTVLESQKVEMDDTSESDVVEPPKEEIEVPSEPEVVEPPKEEVEVPSEPEIVEPPKEEVEIPSEPEVVEPPKVEEQVIPSQPDVIVPSKEETEI